MKKTKEEKKTCELPDVLEFLSLSRKLIVQINLLSKIELPAEYKQQTIGAVKKLVEHGDEFVNMNLNQ